MEQRLTYEGLLYSTKLHSIERSHPSVNAQYPINEEHTANNCGTSPVTFLEGNYGSI